MLFEQQKKNLLGEEEGKGLAKEYYGMRFKNEEDIFTQLNLPYIEPWLRNH